MLVFPASAEAVSKLKVQAQHLKPGDIVGSGETLKLESREEDARIIDSYSYGHGII